MRKLCSLLFLITLCTTVFAQSPMKMGYQVVIRNSNDSLVSNAYVTIKLSILKDSFDGSVVYSETQTILTNENGLATLAFGGGPSFDLIDWSSGIYFLKSEVDPTGGVNFTLNNVTQLLSVPFSFYSNRCKHVDNTLLYTF